MHGIICLDLEGPLSPQDNAYEVMGLIENGHKIFEIISRYDDLIALEGRKGYEPGDTLALIAPFLVYHNISEGDIKKVSEKAILVKGSKGLISQLKRKKWDAYIISTSYQQHAYNIGAQLGIPMEKTICTHFPLDKYRKEFGNTDFSLMESAEKEILALYPPTNDGMIKSKLDKFFWHELPQTNLGKVIKEMKVIGGERKVESIIDISKSLNKKLSELIVVGDSITDYKMLKFIHEKGGISVVFNGNEYAIPYATVGLASTSLSDLMFIIDCWEKGGKTSVVNDVREREKIKEEPYFNLLIDKKDFDEIIKIHKKIRNIVRGRAAKLG